MTKERVPVNGRVVIQEIKEEKKTASGIILVEKDSRGRVKRGTVFLVDEDVEKETRIKRGTTVYYRPNTGYEVPLDGKEYLIVKATDLELVEND